MDIADLIGAAAERREAMTETRTETNSFGPLEVPADKYWGAQTAALAA